MKNKHPKITVYSVWDNKTDDLVALDKTAKECEEILNVPEHAFYFRVSNFKRGLSKRWYIESRKILKESLANDRT